MNESLRNEQQKIDGTTSPRRGRAVKGGRKEEEEEEEEEVVHIASGANIHFVCGEQRLCFSSFLLPFCLSQMLLNRPTLN